MGGAAIPTPHTSSMYAPWGFFHFEAPGLMQTYGLCFAMRAPLLRVMARWRVKIIQNFIQITQRK